METTFDMASVLLASRNEDQARRAYAIALQHLPDADPLHPRGLVNVALIDRVEAAGDGPSARESLHWLDKLLPVPQCADRNRSATA